jgi:tetratricopeptide (TPR) repeat protein
VVSEVRAALEPADENRLASIPTENTEAFEEYLKGRIEWSDRSAQGLEMALEHFRRAIALDSTYALAYSGLADCLAVVPYYSVQSDPRTAFAQGMDAAQEAILLAPDLAEANASLGYLKLVNRRDWDGAELDLRRAVALGPSYPTAHHWLSDLLAFSRRYEEAIVEQQRALELDPLSFINNFTLGHRFYWARQLERAANQYERTVDLHPNNFLGWASLSELLYLMGDVESGARYGRRGDELFGLDPSLVDLLSQRQSHFYATGEPTDLPPEVDTVAGYTPPMRARSAMLVGDTAKALDWIERSVEEEWPDLLVIRVSPLYDPLRSHPRFQALMEEYLGAREPLLSREP